MNKLSEPVQKWVTALRSGKYKQTKRFLRYDDAYCCLGVACELAVEEGLIERTATGYKLLELDPTSLKPAEYHSVLPSVVTNWLGLQDDTGRFAAGGFSSALSVENDGGKTFDQIADIIENEPTLFKEKE